MGGSPGWALHSDRYSPGLQGIVGRSLAGLASWARISCEKGLVPAPLLPLPSQIPPPGPGESPHTPANNRQIRPHH